MIDQGTSNSFATSAIDVVAARDTTPFSEARCTPMRALIFAYLVSPAAKMRKQADAQVALCPTFVDIFADLTQSATRTASIKLPPSEFNRSEVTNLPASFAALMEALSTSMSPGAILPEMEISTLSSLRLGKDFISAAAAMHTLSASPALTRPQAAIPHFCIPIIPRDTALIQPRLRATASAGKPLAAARGTADEVWANVGSAPTAPDRDA